MSQLAKYWPTTEEINNCIKAEAETNDESLILAVHQKMSISKINLNKLNDEEICSEENLLKYFLSNDYMSEGFLLVPITGISGAGKSHAIRWLNANLKKLDAENKKSYIIKIPKTATLKNVVERILEPLKNNSEYKSIYEDLNKVSEEITEETAVIKFEAGLKLAFKDKENQIRGESLNSNTININRELLNTEMGFCKTLPSLFSDIEMKKHFEKVLSRIILRSIKGNNNDELNNEFEFPIFYPQDFEIPDGINASESAKQIQKFYYNDLQDEEKRKKISDFCNSILDNAIQKTFKLHENLGGKTLQDIILDIRRVLLKENKELILLIEDFVALTGIQETLLNICIQSAYEDGLQKYCFMRTAVALTDGYLLNKDTINTRAKYQFKVRSSFNNESEILIQVINLVGAYLNAARYGEKEIKSLYYNSNTQDNWIKPYQNEDISDEDKDVLKEFGFSSHKYNLFPYNNKCISQLSLKHLKDGNEIIYNPRKVINYILREFLIENRDDFLNKKFPQLNFNTSADISTFINKKILEKDRNKYKSFINLWGGNPDKESDLKSIHPNLYKAFGLKPIFDLDDYKEELQSNTKSVNLIMNDDSKYNKISDKVLNTYNTEIIKGSQFSEYDIKWKKWTEDLDKWSNDNISLSQDQARDIRNNISKSIENRINWNHLFIRKREIKATQIFIPNVSKGNPKNESEILIKISDTHKDDTGKLRKSILSVIRLYENNWDLSYPDSSEDLIYFNSFISKLTDIVVSKFREESSNELKPLTQVLLFSSLLLGKNTYNIDKSNTSRIVNSIYENPNEPNKFDGMDKWNEARIKYYHLYDSYKDLFFDRFACFQGTGKNILCINNIIIRESLKKVENIIDTFEDIRNNKEYKYLFEYEFKNNKELIEYLHSSKITSLINDSKIIKNIFIQWKNKLNELIGIEFDKNELITTLNKTISDLNKAGNLWPNNKITFEEIKKIIRNFQELSIKEMLENAKEIEKENTVKTVYIATKFDENVYKLSSDFLDKIPEFFRNVEMKTQQEIDMLNENDPEPIKVEISSLLDSISSIVSELEI